MTGGWATAYLAAMISDEDVLPFFPPPLRFARQTIRQRVRLRRGGHAARLVLSNEYGRGPLVIDAVAVSGGDLTWTSPAMHRGAERREIPAGETAVSDPIPLPAMRPPAPGDDAPGGELVVDCLVDDAAEGSTYLWSAQQTGEAAPGDQRGRAELADAEPFIALCWVARVLTDQPASGPVIVALGDSITRGDGTTPDLNQRYPDHLQRRLLEAGVDGVALNAGIGGNRLLTPVVGPSMTGRFDRDVLGVAEATHVIILAGTNDIALPAMLDERRPAAGEIVDGLWSLARRAAAGGVRPVLATITPFGGAAMEAFLADGNEDVRAAVNDAIRGQREWAVADFAAALADPVDPTRLAAAFDCGDGVHPSDAGARALAAAVDLAVFQRVS